MTSSKGVLVIYTGGTIGSKPRDPDPDSPQVVVPWNELYEGTPQLRDMPFRVDCFERHPALDSCNVSPKDWVAMAECVFDHYDDYEGFVVLHGTDTMVYTAAALSFMLRELGKPVILTGAQRSALVSPRNDATQNILTAIEIANPIASNLPIVPEVCIFFGGKLLRGNCTVKYETVSYEAYDTPNLPPLGLAGDRIVIDESLIRPLPERDRRFNVRTSLDTRVLPLFISPGIQGTKIAQSQLETEDLKAAVVLSFGSGNIPTRTQFLDDFREARRDRKIILANVSQCPVGPVELGIYETSAELLDIGFVSAADITVEAAQCKLMTLLGDPDATIEEREADFQRSLAGEQSISLYVSPYGNDSGGAVSGDMPTKRMRGITLAGTSDPTRIERAHLRLRGARVSGPMLPDASSPQPLGSADTVEAKWTLRAANPANTSPPSPGRAPGSEAPSMPAEASVQTGPVAFRVFLNLAEGAPGSASDPAFAGSFTKWPMDSEGIVIFDVTRAFRAVVRASERTSFTLILDTPSGELRWTSSELAVYVRETGL